MEVVNIIIKTNLSDVYFVSDDENERFDEWFNKKLLDAKFFDWSKQDKPAGIPGVETLNLYVNEFDDAHTVVVFVDVDEGAHSFDELYDNTELLDYIERSLAPKVIDELNALCSDITLPMHEHYFDDMIFGEDDEFYAIIHPSGSKGYTVSPYIRDEQFVLEYDYDVYV